MSSRRRGHTWALSPRLSWPRPLCRRPEAAAPWPAGPPSLPELAGEGAQAGPAPGPSEGTYRELHRFSNVAPSSVATAVLERWDILPALGPKGSALCEGGRATVSASRRRPRPLPASSGAGWGRASATREDAAGAPARRSPVTRRPSCPFPGQETKSRPWRAGSSASQARPGCPGPQGLLRATACEAGSQRTAWGSCGLFGVNCSRRLVVASTRRLVAAAVTSWASRFSSGP